MNSKKNNVKWLSSKLGGEFLLVNIENSPDLQTVEGCGNYLGVFLNGGNDDIEKVNEKAKWIRENSTSLLVGWETDYYDQVPGGLDLELFNFLRVGPKMYEVEMSREITESGEPVYGVIDISD